MLLLSQQTISNNLRLYLACFKFNNCHYEKIGSEVKNIDDEIDFDLPEGWEYIRLCAVCWLDDVKKSVGEKLPYLDAKTLRGKTDITYFTLAINL